MLYRLFRGLQYPVAASFKSNVALTKLEYSQRSFTALTLKLAKDVRRHHIIANYVRDMPRPTLVVVKTLDEGHAIAEILNCDMLVGAMSTNARLHMLSEWQGKKHLVTTLSMLGHLVYRCTFPNNIVLTTYSSLVSGGLLNSMLLMNPTEIHQIIDNQHSSIVKKFPIRFRKALSDHVVLTTEPADQEVYNFPTS